MYITTRPLRCSEGGDSEEVRQGSLTAHNAFQKLWSLHWRGGLCLFFLLLSSSGFLSALRRPRFGFIVRLQAKAQLSLPSLFCLST
jgi:hypothetical protein